MIYIITGIMASGKSTIAQMLAESFDNSVHLRGDIFRKMIVNGRIEMSENAGEEAFRQLRMRYKLAVNAAIEYHKCGFTVFLQDNYLGRMLNELLLLLENYPTQVIALCPSYEAVQKRETARNKVGYKLNTFAVRNLYDMFMSETPRVGWWIDTTELSVEDTVSDIVKRIQSTLT